MTKSLKIKLLREGVKPPEFKTAGAAAMDIYMPNEAGVHSGCSEHFDLGFATEIPEGYCALVMPRSGVGVNSGVGIRNTIGLIDADYRGEWKARITVDEERDFYFIDKGERVLQALFVKCENLPIEIVDELGETERGEGGHGSTGK